MNIISTLIFSDPSLGYDKNNITFPTDLNIKYPGNGSGLCNQLFRVCNSLMFLNPFINIIFFDLFSKDINTGEMIKLSEILSLENMRTKSKYRIYDVTDFEYFALNGQLKGDYQIHNDNYFFRGYHTSKQSFNEIVKSLIWNDKFEIISKKIISESNLSDRLINLVHLRIDEDCRRHVLGNRDDVNVDYTTEFWLNRDKAYNQIIENYRTAIYNNCDKSIPLVLLMEEITHPFVEELKNDFEVLYFDKELVKKFSEEIDGRELFALIDLLIGKNLLVNTFIGMEGNKPLQDGNTHTSSFSIILKNIVNSKNIVMV